MQFFLKNDDKHAFLGGTQNPGVPGDSRRKVLPIIKGVLNLAEVTGSINKLDRIYNLSHELQYPIGKWHMGEIVSWIGSALLAVSP